MTQAHLISLCVFCGSSPGPRSFQEMAQELGQALADAQVSVVFGGGSIGLMGLLADAVLANDGHVTGVIPQFLVDLEVAHQGLSELVVVKSMHERKAEMASRSDAFVALPGGFGTMEEFFEALTWSQLGLHKKPCILLNVNGFFSPLLQFLGASHDLGFISDQSMSLITVVDTIDELMKLLHELRSSEGFREDRT